MGTLWVSQRKVLLVTCVGKGSPEIGFIPAAAMESQVKIGMERNPGGKEEMWPQCGLQVMPREPRARNWIDEADRGVLTWISFWHHPRAGFRLSENTTLLLTLAEWPKAHNSLPLASWSGAAV